MSGNLLVINVDIREVRVALIEDGIIAELHLERKGQTNSGTVGNVVLGKVTRVLPGLQAVSESGHRFREEAVTVEVDDQVGNLDYSVVVLVPLQQIGTQSC